MVYQLPNGKVVYITLEQYLRMSEDDVRKRYGEPYMVSKTSENKIIWTYVPQWKILPDNKNTIYVEFEEGKVVKIIKAR